MTPGEFRTALPAFTDETDATIQAALDASVPWFDVSRWGGFYSEGLANWVAHKIVTDRPAASAASAAAASPGDATDKQVGSVRISRGASIIEKQMADPFLKTGYGQRYRYLAKLVGIGAVAA